MGVATGELASAKAVSEGTKKNVYVQEKVYFCCHRLHFFAVASRVGCPRSTKNVYVQEKVKLS